MSILFPKVPKPREWDYRPIYYDKEKEERRERRERSNDSARQERAERPERTERRPRREDADYELPPLEQATTSLADLFSGFASEDDE